jgi:phasin family protein
MSSMPAQAKQTFEKASEAGQEMTRRLEESYSKTAQDVVNYQRKALEIAQAHVDAAFDCAQDLVGVKSPSEFMEVFMNSTRRQFETMTEQTRELASLAQKVATDNIEPLTNGFNSAFRRRPD